MRAVKVMILDNTFTFGGAITSLSNMLRAVDENKVRPILVSGQPKNYLENNFNCTFYHFGPKLLWVNDRIYRRVLSIPIFRFRVCRMIINFLRYIYWFFFVTLPEAFKYYKIGRNHRIDVIHINNIMDSQLAGILSAILLKIPCIAHLRDFEEIHPITRMYASLIDHHVAISNTIRNNLLQLGVPHNRISLVHDAVDLNEFNCEIDCQYLYDTFPQSNNRPRFGLFGRVVDWKGVREFIYATYFVSKKLPNALGFIVGGCSDGEQSFMDEMVQLIEKLGLSKNIIFTGYRSDIPAMMKFMDIVVHASKRAEPFGMVIIEAMAMAKPIIATKAGGPLDIVVEGKTGFLINIGDIAALIYKICYLLERSDLREKMGKAGLMRVKENFSSRRYARQMEAIYRSE